MAKLYLYPLSIVAAAMWLVHSLFAIMNLTTFECGKGPRHVDYLRGTNTMDLVFSKGLFQNVRVFCQRDSSCRCRARRDSWQPVVWKTPGKIIRDSDDVWNNPWSNKYYSCC
jgi:hypothetical protein